MDSSGEFSLGEEAALAFIDGAIAPFDVRLCALLGLSEARAGLPAPPRVFTDLDKGMALESGKDLLLPLLGRLHDRAVSLPPYALFSASLELLESGGQRCSEPVQRLLDGLEGYFDLRTSVTAVEVRDAFEAEHADFHSPSAAVSGLLMAAHAVCCQGLSLDEAPESERMILHFGDALAQRRDRAMWSAKGPLESLSWTSRGFDEVARSWAKESQLDLAAVVEHLDRAARRAVCGLLVRIGRSI